MLYMPDKIEKSEGDMIPLSTPVFLGKEWQNLKNCLDSGWVSSAGSFVSRFEQEFADYVGSKFAVATINGSAALHIALIVSGVKNDDEVLVSTLSFISPANAIRYVGAWPVFMDCEPMHWQMDPQKVIEFLERECRWQNDTLYNKTTGRKIKAILPVHILGHPIDIDPIVKVARKFNLRIIEDACESLGAKYRGCKVGRFGDIACFSFNGNKIITTGGGGMIVTDNEAWANKARYLITQAKDDSLNNIHDEIGYNYRQTNIHAAIGCAQLELLDDYILAKRRIANNYSEAFNNNPAFLILKEAPWSYSTYWLYTILINDCNINIGELIIALQQEGIQSRKLWLPIHLQKAFNNCQKYRITNSDKLYMKGVCLPSSVNLSVENQNQVIYSMKKLVLMQPD